jgi:hypothetical protein
VPPSRCALSYASTMTSSLELPTRPAYKPTTRNSALMAIGGVSVLLVAWFIWFINTPPDHAVRDREPTPTRSEESPHNVRKYDQPETDRTHPNTRSNFWAEPCLPCSLFRATSNTGSSRFCLRHSLRSSTNLYRHINDVCINLHD